MRFYIDVGINRPLLRVISLKGPHSGLNLGPAHRRNAARYDPETQTPL